MDHQGSPYSTFLKEACVMYLIVELVKEINPLNWQENGTVPRSLWKRVIVTSQVFIYKLEYL